MFLHDIISKSKLGKRLSADARYRTATLAICSLIFNLLYAAYNGVLGYLSSSYWFTAMCAYHGILSVIRSSLILSEKKLDPRKEYAVTRISGIFLSLLSVVLAGIVYMSLSLDVAKKYGTITMITIAAYTFFKIIMAIIRAVKYRKEHSPVIAAMRSIGYTEIAVSVLTMQMSMLVSFEDGMSDRDIFIFNLLTGIGVCIFTLALGIIMIKKSNKGVKRNGKIKARTGK